MDYDDYRALPLWRPLTLRQLRILELMGTAEDPTIQQLALVRFAPAWLAVAIWRRPWLWCLASVLITLTTTMRKAQRLSDWFEQSTFLPAKYKALDTVGQSVQRPASDSATRLSTRIIARLAAVGLWRGDLDISIVEAGEMIVAADELAGGRYLTRAELARAEGVLDGDR